MAGGRSSSCPPLRGPGRSSIVGFEWSVPLSVGTAVSLLAVVSGENDRVTTTERRITELVTGNPKCALRNIAVVNPSPLAGPVARAMLLNIWPSAESETQSVEVDHNGRKLLRGVLLSKRLAKLAKRAHLETVPLSGPEVEAVAQLLHERPDLNEKLDTSAAFHGAKEKSWLTFPRNLNQPEPMILLMNLTKRGAGSVTVRDNEDRWPAGSPFNYILRNDRRYHSRGGHQ